MGRIFRLCLLDCFKNLAYCNDISCMQFIHFLISVSIRYSSVGIKDEPECGSAIFTKTTILAPHIQKKISGYYKLWKLCDYESAGPDTVVDEKHYAPHIATVIDGSLRHVGMSVPRGVEYDTVPQWVYHTALERKKGVNCEFMGRRAKHFELSDFEPQLRNHRWRDTGKYVKLARGDIFISIYVLWYFKFRI